MRRSNDQRGPEHPGRFNLHNLLRGSLRGQIMFLMMLVIVIPVAAVGIFYYYSYRQSLLQDADRILQEAAAAEADTIQNNLEGAEEAMRQLNYSQEFLYFLDGTMQPSSAEQKRFLEDLQEAWLELRHTYPNLIESLMIYASGSTEGSGQSWKLDLRPLEQLQDAGSLSGNIGNSVSGDIEGSVSGKDSSKDKGSVSRGTGNGDTDSISAEAGSRDTAGPDEIITGAVRRIDNSSTVENVTVENSEALVLPIRQPVRNLSTGDLAGVVEMNLSLKNLVGARALVGSGRSILTAVCSDRELVFLGGTQASSVSAEALQRELQETLQAAQQETSQAAQQETPQAAQQEIPQASQQDSANGRAASGTATVTEQGYAGFETGLISLKIGRETFLVRAEQIRGTPLTSLSLMEKKRAVGTANQMIWRVGLLALAAAAMMLLITWLLIRRALLRLTVMDQAMASVERGEFHVQLPPDGYQDEISRTKARFNQMTLRLEDAVQNMIEQENAKKDAELRALQAQINPHFLFNIIETMHMQCEIDRYTKVGDGLASLGGLMRYSMRWEGHTVSFRQEWEQLRNYIELMQLRMDDDLEAELHREDGLENLIVPKMFLQPLVENSFQHGFKGIPAPWKLSVEAAREEGALIVRIRDNGCGVPEGELPALQQALDERTGLQKEGRDRQSIGLVNVLQRMEMVCGPESRIEIRNGTGGGIDIRAVLQYEAVPEVADCIGFVVKNITDECLRMRGFRQHGYAEDAKQAEHPESGYAKSGYPGSGLSISEYSKSEHRMGETPAFQSVATGRNELTIVFGALSTEFLTETGRALFETAAVLRQATRAKVAVGTGEIVYALRDLNRAYETAEAAAAFKIFGTGRTVISYQEIKAGGPAGSRKPLQTRKWPDPTEENLQAIQKVFSAQIKDDPGAAALEQLRCDYESLCTLISERLRSKGAKLWSGRSFSELWDEFDLRREIRDRILYLDSTAAEGTAEQSGLLHEIIAFTKEHVTEEIDLNYLADHFGKSPGYIGSLFRKGNQQGFNEFVTAERMKIAQRLLLDRALSVQDVAKKCGYYNTKYFSVVFKKVTGTSPKSYQLKASV